jgi:hypothetical protein
MFWMFVGLTVSVAQTDKNKSSQGSFAEGL